MLAVGALSFPLAVAGAQLGSPRVAVTVMFVAGVVSAVRYLCRRCQRERQSRPVRPVTAAKSTYEASAIETLAGGDGGLVTCDQTCKVCQTQT